MDREHREALTRIEATQHQVMDEFEHHMKNFGDLTNVSVQLSLMCLHLVQEVSPNRGAALNKMKELVANLELTDAQHAIMQPLLSGLLKLERTGGPTPKA